MMSTFIGAHLTGRTRIVADLPSLPPFRGSLQRQQGADRNVEVEHRGRSELDADRAVDGLELQVGDLDQVVTGNDTGQLQVDVGLSRGVDQVEVDRRAPQLDTQVRGETVVDERAAVPFDLLVGPDGVSPGLELSLDQLRAMLLVEL